MPKYAPGSFSKNFAWHGEGLRKLHDAIRQGLASAMAAVPRNEFRRRCGIEEEGLQLIPVNFFLHNQITEGKNWVSVDELVLAAVKRPHSQLFDRLALFALHLNMAGERSGQNGVAQPALWIKEFVTDSLWRDGAWRPEALSAEAMDAYFSTNLAAQPHVRTKCRSNYRYLLGQCNYLTFAADAADSGAEQWIVPAIFLTWDRLALRRKPVTELSRRRIIDDLIARDTHKLAGTTEEFVRECADAVLDDYLASGGLMRFGAQPAIATPKPTGDVPVRKQESAKTKAGRGKREQGKATPDFEELELDYSVAESVKRRLREVQTQVRNSAHVVRLKALYKDACQFCGTTLQVETSPDRFFSNGAHIKPVGKPFNGPDSPGNLLVLCPNHHVEFDCGMLTMARKGSKYVIHARQRGHVLQGVEVRIHAKHRLEESLVQWHAEFFAGRRQ